MRDTAVIRAAPRDGEGIVQRTNVGHREAGGAERRSVKKIRRFTACRFESGPRDQRKNQELHTVADMMTRYA